MRSSRKASVLVIVAMGVIESGRSVFVVIGMGGTAEAVFLEELHAIKKKTCKKNKPYRGFIN